MASVVNGTPIPSDDDLVHGELKNIRNMIRLTQTNLEMLNQRFSSYQHPPSIYLQEYEYLTSRLDDFQSREQELLDALGNSTTGNNSTTAAPTSSGTGASGINNTVTSSTVYTIVSETGLPSPATCAAASSLTPGSYSTATVSLLAFNGSQSPDETNFTTATLDGGPVSSVVSRGGNIGGDGGAPRSPMRSVVRIELPNAQHTTVQVRPGQTVVEALAKAMKRRKLSPEMCLAYKADSGELVDWDTDMGALGGDAELSVRISLLAMQDGVEPPPAHYKPFIEEASPPRAIPGGGSGRGGVDGSHDEAAGAPLTAQRERSTSAPNVSYNMVNQDFSADLSKYKSQVYSSPGK
ncbi:hypothetical protein BIW11_08875 [Tropilaelaps mercedesae]|uniref:RBD domain-containing protein n=1 Tax=Tropilaelaps mercedesae TaxID=418985 RepID=A0A1V9XMK4_9ACAR|nr:hypothetical protein BIW11_08875 [Tropilaelaps mercedesae]